MSTPTRDSDHHESLAPPPPPDPPPPENESEEEDDDEKSDEDEDDEDDQPDELNEPPEYDDECPRPPLVIQPLLSPMMMKAGNPTIQKKKKAINQPGMPSCRDGAWATVRPLPKYASPRTVASIASTPFSIPRAKSPC